MRILVMVHFGDIRQNDELRGEAAARLPVPEEAELAAINEDSWEYAHWGM